MFDFSQLSTLLLSRVKTSDSKIYALKAQFFRAEKCCSEPMKLHYSHVTQWRGNRSNCALTNFDVYEVLALRMPRTGEFSAIAAMI